MAAAALAVFAIAGCGGGTTTVISTGSPAATTNVGTATGAAREGLIRACEKAREDFKNGVPKALQGQLETVAPGCLQVGIDITP